MRDYYDKCGVCGATDNILEHNFFEMLITLCDDCFEEFIQEIHTAEQIAVPQIFQKFGII